MNYSLVLAGIVLSVALLVVARPMRRSWTSKAHSIAITPAFLGGTSKQLRPHYVRAQPTFFLSIALLTVAGWCAVFDITVLVVAFGLGSVVAILVLVPCVVIFNRPKVLVRPYQRGEPGLLQKVRDQS